MNRALAVGFVFLATPFVVGLARASFGVERVAAPKVARELAAVAEPSALERRYGVAVVAMPEPPSRLAMTDGRSPMADCRSPIADCRLPMADSRLPIADDRLPILACPDIRAIIGGSDPFAIVAYGETSTVVHNGQSVETPAGPVVVRRIGGQSIAFAQADTTLKCQLLVR